jgi:hypothetical protein
MYGEAMEPILENGSKIKFQNSNFGSDDHQVKFRDPKSDPIIFRDPKLKSDPIKFRDPNFDAEEMKMENIRQSKNLKLEEEIVTSSDFGMTASDFGSGNRKRNVYSL